ncbi:disulfide oxidoreductase [Burkholderia sp. Bp9017]|uniref:disulfide oxidoreductase n=1 Tax=Burkholderia TaxID=32008 RepID=UPI000F5DB2FF|nr:MULTISPECIES: disulfide oxidoreductase [Burkholderia]RQZ31603.1 disulfide oxidoreductase [Burkholderia sp. Bp9017]RQZ37734.1 disulfide oxidoreductase [Burkholderia sp. Bp9016]
MNQSRRRRVLGVVAAAGIAAPMRAFSQLTLGGPKSALPETLTPYLVVGDFAEDRGKVFMFFDFNCHFCQANWRAMALWGSTLPKGFRFIDVPVVFDTPDSKVAAAAFYVVKVLAPARLEEFKARAYATAESGRGTAAQYGAILRSMGLDRDLVVKTVRGADVLDRIRRAVELTQRYTVEVTPSFGVGGQYETNANFTNGDYVLLAKLLSGLVSRQIEQGKTRA